MDKDKKQYILHFLMCGMGGFLGAYAMLLRGGNFGSAVTGNLLECMIHLAEWNWQEVVIRAGASILFIIPFFLSKWIDKKTQWNRRFLCLGLEIFCLLICSCLPLGIHPVLALYPIFFTSSFQWSVFRGTDDYVCSTIFISNNTKEWASSFADFLMTHDPSQKKHADFYGKSVLCFLFIGLLSTILTLHLGPQSALIALIIPLLSLMVLKTQAIQP